MIIPVQVESISDAQIVRAIRNELRQHMTNSNAWITDEQQVQFFREKIKDGNSLLYYYINEHYAIVGFSYLRVKDSIWTWGTLGVLPEFQGKGYGTEIYKHMLSLGKIALEIFSDNNPSLVAALKAGFVIKGFNDKIIYMESKE